jgi:hypothetical protein
MIALQATELSPAEFLGFLAFAIAMGIFACCCFANSLHP